MSTTRKCHIIIRWLWVNSVCVAVNLCLSTRRDWAHQEMATNVADVVYYFFLSLSFSFSLSLSVCLLRGEVLHNLLKVLTFRSEKLLTPAFSLTLVNETDWGEKWPRFDCPMSLRHTYIDQRWKSFWHRHSVPLVNNFLMLYCNNE